MDKTENKFVSFASSLDYASLSGAAIYAAKIRIIDAFGCALGAYDAPTANVCRKLAAPVSEGPRARILGTLESVSIEHATLTNSAMVRYLDMSDAYLMTSTAHPSDNFPGILAIGDAYGASGNDVLLATLISYEAHCRVCDVAPFGPNGWDQPIAGAPAMALAASRLLGLDLVMMRHAVAIAVVSSVALDQTRRGALSMWKGMAGPDAARKGVYAALLAQAGMTGPENPFEGKHGLWAKTVGAPCDIPIPEHIEGHIFALQQTNIKSYPVRDAIQIPVKTALKLRERLTADDIETLVIHTYRHAFLKAIDEPSTWDPRTRESADHCLPFCLAAALVDGDVTPDSFKNDRYLKNDVRRLMARMKIEFEAAYDEVAPATRSCRLEAVTKSGDVVVVEHIQTPEDILKGPSKQQVEQKFRTLSSAAINSDQQDALLEHLWALDELEDIGKLLDLTKV
jgi:2-methylcitrate dehydratase